MTSIWSRFSTSRVFNWSSILSEWNNSMRMPINVEVILTNLKEACEADSTYEPTLEQFLSYLNNEQAGITWFLFEAITHRWMWSTPRLDYVRALVDEIENLDGYFPEFPGSPGNTLTIRQWVNQNLDEDELEYVSMMPPLVSQYNYSNERGYQTPTRRTQPATTNAPLRPTTAARAKPAYASIQFRLLRDTDMSTKGGKTDDILSILKAGDDLYTVVYNDQHSDVKTRTNNLTQTQVTKFLSNMFRLLTVDDEPFETIQVILPGLPSIMVSPENLTSQTRDLIYDSVEMTMGSWPTIV